LLNNSMAGNDDDGDKAFIARCCLITIETKQIYDLWLR